MVVVSASVVVVGGAAHSGVLAHCGTSQQSTPCENVGSAPPCRAQKARVTPAMHCVSELKQPMPQKSRAASLHSVSHG